MDVTSHQQTGDLLVEDGEVDNPANAGCGTLEMMMDDQFIDTGAVEEVVDQDGDEYDCAVSSQLEQNLLFELYQPIETADSLICKICLQLGKHVEFLDRQQYSTHRYKVHGSYNNCVVCPVMSCKEVYASMIILRKHLMIEHKLPLEMHHQIFANMGEFERWRHLVELASNSRFMMHTKQPHHKRQVMHCSRSEHKMVLQSKKHKLPRLRMQKESSCCPAVISFRVDERTGHVHTFYQLVHVGHATQDGMEPEESQSVFTVDATGTGRLPSLHFPEKPLYLGERAMQYLQIDLIEMESAVYMSYVYANILVVTDLHTGFTWAKPMPDSVNKQLLLRILTDIFCQYGVPDGYCCSASHSQRLVRDVISTLNGVFRVHMKEVFNEMPDYDWFRNMLLDQAASELKSSLRWVEMLQFAVMTMNQTGPRSPFERMFKRSPFGVSPAPWLGDDSLHGHGPSGEEDSDNQDEAIVVTARYQVGDHVYLRNVDSRPGRGNAVPYLYGLIGEVDWEGSPCFPYRVHFSKNSDLWPTEACVSTWATPYDVLPTTHDLMMIRDEDRRRVMSTLLCSCRRDRNTSEETKSVVPLASASSSSESDQPPPCQLFRSHACANGMSRICCTASGKECPFHEFLVGEESYNKMELVSRYYSKDCPVNEKRRLERLIRSRYSRGRDLPLSRDEDTRSPTISDVDAHDLLEVNMAGSNMGHSLEAAGRGAGSMARTRSPAILRRRGANRVLGASSIVVVTEGSIPVAGPSVDVVSDNVPPACHTGSSLSTGKEDMMQMAANTTTSYSSGKEPAEVVDRHQSPPTKRLRRTHNDTQEQIMGDRVIKQEVSDSLDSSTGKSPQLAPTRRSSRPVKAKVFNDFVT